MEEYKYNKNSNRPISPTSEHIKAGRSHILIDSSHMRQISLVCTYKENTRGHIRTVQVVTCISIRDGLLHTIYLSFDSQVFES